MGAFDHLLVIPDGDKNTVALVNMQGWTEPAGGSDVVPNGVYLAKIADPAWKTKGEGAKQPGKNYSHRLVIQEPVEFKGMQVRDNIPQPHEVGDDNYERFQGLVGAVASQKGALPQLVGSAQAVPFSPAAMDGALVAVRTKLRPARKDPKTGRQYREAAEVAFYVTKERAERIGPDPVQPAHGGAGQQSVPDLLAGMAGGNGAGQQQQAASAAQQAAPAQQQAPSLDSMLFGARK